VSADRELRDELERAQAGVTLRKARLERTPQQVALDATASLSSLASEEAAWAAELPALEREVEGLRLITMRRKLELAEQAADSVPMKVWRLTGFIGFIGAAAWGGRALAEGWSASVPHLAGLGAALAGGALTGWMLVRAGGRMRGRAP
jgi:hypothetical protein